MLHEALYYTRQDHNVRCDLCPKTCLIPPDKTGFCRVRRNRDGKLMTENYGACSSWALDPIEKKPLYHFYPGSHIFSIGTWGCNFACQFCQNWQIAQKSPPTEELAPGEAVAMAVRAGRNNIGIAYTYSEPSVWYEYIRDTALLARQEQLKNVMITNGYINAGPLQELLPLIDAMNIDVKAFNAPFYRQMCAGELERVKETVELAAESCHVEVTTLLIPGQNDKRQEIAALAKWLASIDKNIPLHFSRYFPNYQMELPPTPAATLEMAYEEARQYLSYVYLGNLAGRGVNTYCPACGQLIIDRQTGCSYATPDQECPRCREPVSVIGPIYLRGCHA
ncbi:AmmeMemoRadiSam system radical SAM enzyme [Lucifera butyrica]|nr:AmmeMemoRadiSam system radical SAM enzyme [Lucifera butyrica]